MLETRSTIRLPRTPQAVVFDMDGLLFDTETLARDAMMRTAPDFGYEMPVSLYLDMIGLPGDATRSVLRQHFGEAFDADKFWDRAAAHFEMLVATELRLKPGVTELVGLLEEMGLRFAIATSSRHDDVQRNLAIRALTDSFPTVVAYGDYVCGKPHPDPFVTAAKRLAVAPEFCLALEDSHNGVRSATSAGMMTVMVPDLLPPTEDVRAICVGIANSLHDVSEALKATQRQANDAPRSPS
ncbi:HAD family phosphatase [Ensifer adhaerens]|uniref:HAD family hydrolase n=1 Tax=Ensifer adhaerens TaxID=106592 RepID=UPI001CBCF339|nr:HAD family phosphatase [Ensifer adhaerens]MBZ7921104.1 HAD family phosphatase [Ensifer adhaerens]UAX93547.1 HAD family phosphatase [Ensifer adhaerens]UAY01183.1 HAD family phosphatase [Ensifer adhaerens]UAY08565.1 HAD family phosphatase [Ensifer adhaerens]